MSTRRRPTRSAVVLIALGCALALTAMATASLSAPTRDAALAKLGKKLFSDRRLSADWSVSCSTCHDPGRAYTDGRSLAVGVESRVGRRNAPSIVNAAHSPNFFWDGRAASLEEQAARPFLEPTEMGMASAEAVEARVASFGSYQRAFTAVYGTADVTMDKIVRAIAAFERTVVSEPTPFDRYMDGDESALSPSARRGWKLFRGAAGCVACHRYDPQAPFLTDFAFHNTGVAFLGVADERIAAVVGAVEGASASPTALSAAAAPDLGRYVVSGRPEDVGAFKTPSLKNVARTAPYMHDGSFETLADVLRFYAAGGHPNPYLDPAVRRLSLDRGELRDLEAFLGALSEPAANDGEPRG